MTLVQIPTEQTTAATDLLISVLAVASALYLRKRGPDGLRGQLWRSVLLLLALAALLGAIAHGVVLGQGTFTFTWRATYLALTLLIGAFFLAAYRDLVGDARSRRLVPGVLIVTLGFYSLFVVSPENFLPFILYETAVMLFALGAFIWLSWQNELPGARWIAVSIAVNIVAAAIQATGTVAFTVIWPFDHNGAFHLVQIIGIALLVRGLRS